MVVMTDMIVTISLIGVIVLIVLGSLSLAT
jgi:hypothetical protein